MKRKMTRCGVSIQTIAEEYDLEPSFLYEASRKGKLPGMMRIGRLIRVDPERFREAVTEGEFEAPYE